MMTMTVPQMTSMFLATVVCLGAALVWMFWELQRPARFRRRSDRFRATLTGRLRQRLKRIG
jgi:hypothetical protein